MRARVLHSNARLYDVFENARFLAVFFNFFCHNTIDIAIYCVYNYH